MMQRNILCQTFLAGTFCALLLFIGCQKSESSGRMSQLPLKNNLPDTLTGAAVQDKEYGAVSDVNKTAEDSNAIAQLSEMSNNGEMNFTDSTLTIPLLRHLLVKDSGMGCSKLAEFSFNGEPMVRVSYVPVSSDNEETLYTLSPLFLQFLLTRADTPEFATLFRNVTFFEGSQHDLKTTLRGIIDSRKLLLKSPELARVMLDDRRAKRATREGGEAASENGEEQEGKRGAQEIIMDLRSISEKFTEKIEPCTYPLHFWAECELDSVADLTEKLITKVVQIIDPSLLESNEIQAPAQVDAVPMFFTPRSFIDPDVETRSIFDRRDQLIELYLDDVVRTLCGDSVRVKDSGLLQKIRKMNSEFFNPEQTCFALVADGADATWKRIVPELQLKFSSHEYCSSDKVLLVNLMVTGAQSTPAMLFAALPTDAYVKKGKVPSGYFPAKLLSENTLRVNKPSVEGGYDSLQKEVTSVFAVPDTEKKIRQLLRVDGFGTSGGVPITVMSIFSAVMHSGDTVEVLKDVTFGHHSPENAMIGDPLLIDINGDHLLDIVVDASGARKLLFIQLEYGGFEMRTLIHRDATGSGGC